MVSRPPNKSESGAGLGIYRAHLRFSAGGRGRGQGPRLTRQRPLNASFSRENRPC